MLKKMKKVWDKNDTLQTVVYAVFSCSLIVAMMVGLFITAFPKDPELEAQAKINQEKAAVTAAFFENMSEEQKLMKQEKLDKLLEMEMEESPYFEYVEYEPVTKN